MFSCILCFATDDHVPTYVITKDHVVSSEVEDKSEVRTRRIEHKIAKLSADVDDVTAQFDEAFETVVQEDEISALQGEYSKLSWDDSVSPTTNTMADMAQNQLTPDNDIQELTTGIISK